MSRGVIGQQSEEMEVLDSLLECEIKEQIEARKEQKLDQLENAELSAAKNSDYVSATREEIKETQLRVDTLTSQLSQCHKQNSELENKARELQEMSDRAHDLHRRQMSEKDRHVSEMRHRLQAQLEDYEHLLDVKLALDMEINAYRKMLEGEEQRLRLSPGSSKRSPVSRTSTSPTGRILRGKRKLEGSETAEGRRGYKIVQQASSTGRVAVDEIDPQGKFVRLLNNSQEDQQLHGWGLRRRHASLPETVYKFPSRFVLKSSQHVTIWAAGAGAVHTLPSDLVWKAQQSWGTGDDMKVTLLDVDGEESADRAIYRIRRGEDESEEDLFEEAVTEGPFHSQSVDPSCSVM
ncbi:lamin-B3-like [Ascaphus truei]|uniref:lamin-B3-like n=1 Tax=Ascaphus truei TaxID=8439 RepID=UPI003F5903BD